VSLTRLEVALILQELRPEAEFEWMKEQALRVGDYTDNLDYYHPGFILNFLGVDERDIEFKTLMFGVKFYMQNTLALEWINEQNSKLRFSTLFWDENGLAVNLDVYSPNTLIDREIFEANYCIFDETLVVIAATANAAI
jgi:hypothetical protein